MNDQQSGASFASSSSMDLDLPEEHRAFRDMVESFVQAELPKDWARELEQKEDKSPFELWKKRWRGPWAGLHGSGELRPLRA